MFLLTRIISFLGIIQSGFQFCAFRNHIAVHRDKYNLRPLFQKKEPPYERESDIQVHSSLTDTEKWMSMIKDFSKVEGGWEDVLVVVDEMRIAGVPITGHVYHSAMQACCNQGQAQKALDLFHLMKQESIQNDSVNKVVSAPDKYCYDVAISACRRLKKPEKALYLLEEMMSFGETFSPSMYTYNEVFRAVRGTPGALMHTDRLLPQMLERQKGGSIVPKSRTVCLTLMWILADNGQWRRAVKLLNDMREQGVYPDRECYCAAIAACYEGSAWREATRLLDQQQFEGRAHPQVTPDASSYRLTVLACAEEASKNGPDSEEALGRGLIVLKQMREANVQSDPKDLIDMYRKIIEVCVADRNQWERALELFSQIRKICKGTVIPGPLYRSIIHILSSSSANRWREAHALLEEARTAKRNLTTVTYNSVIKMLCKAGELELAYSVFREMRQGKKIPGVDSYNQLLDGCSKIGEWRKALALLEEMGMDNLKPDSFSYRATIAALANGGEWERGLALVARIAKLGLNPNIHCYNAALLGCAKAGTERGAWERAQAMVEKMKKEGPTPDIYSFNALIEAYVKGGHPDLALSQLDVLDVFDVKPDEYTFGNLIKACQRGGRWEVALDLLETMKERGLPRNVVCYTAAMGVIGEAGRVDIAEQLFLDMSTNGIVPAVVTYNSAIVAAAKSRDLSSALKFFATIKRSGLTPDLQTYSSLLGACAKTLAWQKALELLEDTRKNGLIPNVYTYTAAMKACCKSRQYKHTLDLFQEMIKENIKPEEAAYRVAIEAYENTGQLSAAQMLVNEMIEAGYTLPEKDDSGDDFWR